MAVLTLDQLPGGVAALNAVLARFHLVLTVVPCGQQIPGSYWGDTEAGLVGNQVFARLDTPVHSVLHEACHAVCMTPNRRQALHTDAGGDDLEENAVCYLQILLADQVPELGSGRMLSDMDAWGYSFRLGSAKAWFEEDAAEVVQWLKEKGLVEGLDQVTWQRRGEVPCL